MNVEQFKDFQDDLFALNQKTWGILNDLETRHKARAKIKFKKLIDKLEDTVYSSRDILEEQW